MDANTANIMDVTLRLVNWLACDYIACNDTGVRLLILQMSAEERQLVADRPKDICHGDPLERMARA